MRLGEAVPCREFPASYQDVGDTACGVSRFVPGPLAGDRLGGRQLRRASAGFTPPPDHGGVAKQTGAIRQAPPGKHSASGIVRSMQRATAPTEISTAGRASFQAYVRLALQPAAAGVKTLTPQGVLHSCPVGDYRPRWRGRAAARGLSPSGA